MDNLEVIDNPAKMVYLTQTTLSLDETRDIVARLRSSVFRSSMGPNPRIFAMQPRTVRRPSKVFQRSAN